MSSISHLNARDRIKARDIAVGAMTVAYNNRGNVHYTQSAQRWEGINRRLKAYKGQYPHYADCSSLTTWALWNAYDHFGINTDRVNGASWRAGFTGTQLTHGKIVRNHSNIQRGDLAIYGNGAPGKHVAMCIGGGMVLSHGSESGPHKLPLHYRGDLMQIRRYI